MGARWLYLVPLAAVGGALLLRGNQLREERKLEPLWQELQRPAQTAVFDPASIEGLPAPAQRYLRRAIAPGTPLARSVQLEMHGAMRLSPGAEVMPMQAEQVLAPPSGFVWKARVAKGPMRIEGFDAYGHGEGALRWWLLGLVPVVNASGPDVTRSAAGRLAGEAVLVPSTLLPQEGAVWEAVDDTTARVRLSVDDVPSKITLTVDEEGRLRRVSLMRWREDAGNGTPGYVRFDVDEWGNERTFGGYTIQTAFRAGWRLGESDEFPFFYATVDSATYR